MGRRFLVVDVGGTAVKWAVATDGVLGRVKRTSTRRETPASLIDQLRHIHATVAHNDPLPWAVCIAGIVDTRRGRVVRSANLGLENEKVVERLSAYGTAPTIIVNDVAAAAAGEAAGGTLALLQIGSGVAGRIVVDGAVLSGEHGYGGEVGHIVFVPGGRPCTCGLAGCVEAYGGMRSIRKRYGELGRPVPSARQVLTDAASDPDVAELFADAIDALAFAAAILVISCDPATLRLGGGVSAAWGEELRTAVAKGAANRVAPGLSERTRFELSPFGDRAPLLGLLRLAGVIPSG